MTVTISGGVQFTGGSYVGPQPGVDCDPYYANVSLLLHCEGTGHVTPGNFLDNSTNNNILASIGGTVFNVFNYDTSIYKWGTSSINGGGVNYGENWGIYNDSSLWDFGSGDFTVECWAYRDIAGSGFSTGYTQFFIGRAAPTLSSSTASWGLGYTGGTGAWIQGAPYMSIINSVGTVFEIFGNSALTAGVWHHIALSRVGSTVYLLVDGSVSGTTSITGAVQNPASAVLAIGCYGDNGLNFPPCATPASMDDIRITKGVGRYSGSYTVPSAPFPNTGC